MKKYGNVNWRAFFAIVFLTALAGHCFGQSLEKAVSSKHLYAERDEKADRGLAVVNVNVVPMTGNIIMEKQNVIVRNGRIILIGPVGKVKIPKNAQIVDGTGKFLMPGIVDFHVHFPTDTSDFPITLQMFLANGITTIVNMNGSPELLRLRSRIYNGEIAGPTLFSTGPFLNITIVNSADEVEAAVVSEKQAGYDYIKIHGDLTVEEYDRLFAVARRVGITVVGHVPGNLGIKAALKSRQPLIVHAEEFLNTYFTFKRPLPTSADEIDSTVKFIATETKKAGIWVSPTLAVFDNIIDQLDSIQAVLSRPEMQFMSAATLKSWSPVNNPYILRWRKPDAIRFSAEYRVMERLVLGFHQAGVPLLVGTDCMVPSVIPGYSIHDELNRLADAGLSPYEILKAATINAATFLQIDDQTGTVEVGKQADLLLINANPLKTVSNIKLRAGIFLRGKWIPESKLQGDLVKLKKIRDHKS